MISITQLQEYLHHIAQQQYEIVKTPPFTLYFHPSETLTFFNYGIPNLTQIESIGAALTKVRIEFSNRNRQARFEYLEEFNPKRRTIMRHKSFIEDSR